MNLDWFVGFAEGEGTFSICIGKSTTKIGWRMTPRFKINLIIDDRQVLEKIKSFLESKNIFPPKLGFADGSQWSPNSSHQTILTITKLKSCYNLGKLIYPLMVTKKKKDVQIWLQIIEKIMIGKHLYKEGFLEIMILVEKLRSLRKERKKRKYTKAYFIKLWNR